MVGGGLHTDHKNLTKPSNPPKMGLSIYYEWREWENGEIDKSK